jgi:SAM-dependent methyltransferase
MTHTAAAPLPTDDTLPAAAVPTERVPGHWLLARLGKRVLRPGGVELTRRLLSSLAIGERDDVVELAPGLGATTALVLERNPRSYTGVDRDPVSTARVARMLHGPAQEVLQGTAADTGMSDASADVVFGEAYLTMQPASQKERILTELARVSRPGARLGLHEIAFSPAGIDEPTARRVAGELTRSIKVNVSPLTMEGWCQLLEASGFEVHERFVAPLALLEPRRLLADEGYLGTARFVGNTLRDRDARARVLAMRRSMRANAAHLQACAIAATRVAGG